MKFGYNITDITPSVPVKMAGFNREGYSQGVLDPIQISTLVISIDRQLIILSFLDSIIIEDSVIAPVKKHLQKKYNISSSQIIIGCIHTHSAPAFFRPFFEETPAEESLQKALVPQFISSIEEAIKNINEGTYMISSTLINGLYGNRNEKDGYSDKTALVFSFTHLYEDHPCFSLIHFACHPTILNKSNMLLSADLVGAIRVKFTHKYNHDCMVINGCCGDVSTRFYRELTGYEELDRISTSFINQLNSLHSLNYHLDAPLSASIQEQFIFNGKTDQFTQDKIEEFKNILSGNQDNRKTLYASMLLKNLQLKEKLSPMTLLLTSNVIIMGQVILISLPGDITAILGKRLKDAFKDHLVIPIGYCENYSNYFVSSKDYGKYFETYISRLEEGNADIFIDHITDKINSLISQ